MLGASTQPHTHKYNLQVGVLPEKVNIIAPRGSVALRLKLQRDDPVCVLVVLPAGVVAEPADQALACLLLHAWQHGRWWAITYTAHTVFSAPHGEAEYTRCTALCNARITTIREYAQAIPVPTPGHSYVCCHGSAAVRLPITHTHFVRETMNQQPTNPVWTAHGTAGYESQAQVSEHLIRPFKTKTCLRHTHTHNGNRKNKNRARKAVKENSSGTAELSQTSFGLLTNAVMCSIGFGHSSSSHPCPACESVLHHQQTIIHLQRRTHTHTHTHQNHLVPITCIPGLGPAVCGRRGARGRAGGMCCELRCVWQEWDVRCAVTCVAHGTGTAPVQCCPSAGKAGVAQAQHSVASASASQ